MEKIRTIKLFRNYYKEFYVAQTADRRIIYERRKEKGNHELYNF